MTDFIRLKLPKQTDNRVIRVFISSTFRDMMRERELLVKRVFPEIRGLCDERFITFTEVDLRWGITQEQAAEGKVLPICLEEIDTCRPYFLGLLGERYGWISHCIPQEVIELVPWVREHVEDGKSVTELEILHGVLKNPEMANHAFFYFRDPAYIDSPDLRDDERAEMVEHDIPDDIKTFGPEVAARRTQQRRDRLISLKDRIRAAHVPLVDGYPTPEAFAEIVEQQFRDLIDELYPEGQVPDPLDQEALRQRAFAQQKLLAYVDRPAHTLALDDFAATESSGRGLVVTGDSGGGKTALLAQWTSQYRTRHPDHIVFEHYFGSTSDSASVPRFLARLLGECKRLANITDDIPTAPSLMAEALPEWLALTGTGDGRPFVLIFDALNQIEGDPADRHLAWLPRRFPPHCRVIAAALPGEALHALKERKWAEYGLPLPNTDERGQMIDTFLGYYRKDLGRALRTRVVEAPGSANPLFLRAVLEELRQFGSFERLPDTVADYLQAATPIELFRKVIRRWHDDFHADRNVVYRSLRCLWAARMGLRENEWLGLLADDHGPMDRQTLRPLLLAMAPHLAQRAGLLAFGHDFLKQAVEDELLCDNTMRQEAHSQLADYFGDGVDMTIRKAAEWPWSLLRAQRHDELVDALVGLWSLLNLARHAYDDIPGYWRFLAGQVNPVERYESAWTLVSNETSPGMSDIVSDYAYTIGRVLEDVGFLREAAAFYERFLNRRVKERKSQGLSVQIARRTYAACLARSGDYSKARHLLQAALDELTQLVGPHHPSALDAASDLARVLQHEGDFDGAQNLHYLVLEASGWGVRPSMPAAMYARAFADFLRTWGEKRKALEVAQAAAASLTQLRGPAAHPTLMAQFDVGRLECEVGDTDQGQATLSRAASALVDLLGPDHPDARMAVSASNEWQTGGHCDATEPTGGFS